MRRREDPAGRLGEGQLRYDLRCRADSWRGYGAALKAAALHLNLKQAEGYIAAVLLRFCQRSTAWAGRIYLFAPRLAERCRFAVSSSQKLRCPKCSLLWCRR